MVKNDRQCYHGVDLKQNDQLVYFLLNQKDLGRISKEKLQADLCVVTQGACNARAKMFSYTCEVCMVKKVEKV